MKKSLAIVLASILSILTITTALASAAATGYTSGGQYGTVACESVFDYSDSSSAGRDWVSGQTCSEDWEGAHWVRAQLNYYDADGKSGTKTVEDDQIGVCATASAVAPSGCDGYRGRTSHSVETDYYGSWQKSHSAEW